MIRCSLIALTLTLGTAHAGTLDVKQLDASAPPVKLAVKGKRLVQLWQWKGADGLPSYLALSSTSSTTQGESRELYAQIFTGAQRRELRLVRDGITSCKLDLTASFVAGSVSITDEDADSTPEIAFAYDLDCDARAKATPRKLIVIEGADKHALRGTARGEDDDGKPIGGDFKADFKNAPKLQPWAEARWKALLAVPPINVDP